MSTSNRRASFVARMSACRSAGIAPCWAWRASASIATRDRPSTTTSRQGGASSAVHRASVLRDPPRGADAERGGPSTASRTAADAADADRSTRAEARTTRPLRDAGLSLPAARSDDRAADMSGGRHRLYPDRPQLSLPGRRHRLGGRAVLSWRLSNTIDAWFCVAALEEALADTASRKFSTRTRAASSPAPISPGADQAHVRISMDGRGRWMDNVFIERVWRSLKYEDVYLRATATVARRKPASAIRSFLQTTRLMGRSAICVPIAVSREGVATAYGHVDDTNALTTCPQAVRNSSSRPLAA